MREADILVLDFGSAYSALIAQKLRGEGVYAALVPFNIKASEIKKLKPKGLILGSGPANIYASEAHICDKAIFDLGLPILGIGYGMQLIARQFGCILGAISHKEYVREKLEIDNSSLLFRGLEDRQLVWLSKTDQLENVPSGFKKVASSNEAPNAGFEDAGRKIFGLQFHPEVAQTQSGAKILKNFAKYACSCESVWNMGSFAKKQIADIKERVGGKTVLCAVSGGVDSSVVAALLASAVPSNTVLLFVDTGLLRHREREWVEIFFKRKFGLKLNVVDAKELFLGRLKGVIDPEKKRKIIGATFFEVFEDFAKKQENLKFLAQGTLYTDVLESGQGGGKLIKSHHNVGGLPQRMNLELLEPLREIFKDEVRLLGLELGLEKDQVYRHPFPGPGLAVRIMGEVNEKSLNLLRRADEIFMDELKASAYYSKVWQAFCVLLNVESVGVRQGQRVVENTIALRAVDASDGRSASVSSLPLDLLCRVSDRICNEVEGICRVVYDLSKKPPATIEWE